jgi:histone acetyltransferase (RNA polymerase elongator complex component)
MKAHYRKSAGKPFIIPIFLPESGCPHRCVFCNQAAITGQKHRYLSLKTIDDQIRTFLSYQGQTRKHVQIAFFGGNFLGQDESYICQLLSKATQFVHSGQVQGIRFSTRPDTICDHLLDIIARFPVETIEIGVQSMNDQVLALSGRGHTAADTQKAICQLKARGYEIGAQLMVGLPGDNRQRCFASGERIVLLAPAFVRIYPTLVFPDSVLARWYAAGKYKPLSIAASIKQVKMLYLQFTQAGIAVVRMGLQPTSTLSCAHMRPAGPFHPAFGHLVHSEIYLDRAARAINKLGKPFKKDTRPLLIRVNPRDLSKMRGLKSHNITLLKRLYPMKSVKILPDTAIAPGCIRIN